MLPRLRFSVDKEESDNASDGDDSTSDGTNSDSDDSGSSCTSESGTDVGHDNEEARGTKRRGEHVLSVESEPVIPKRRCTEVDPRPILPQLRERSPVHDMVPPRACPAPPWTSAWCDRLPLHLPLANEADTPVYVRHGTRSTRFESIRTPMASPQSSPQPTTDGVLAYLVLFNGGVDMMLVTDVADAASRADLDDHPIRRCASQPHTAVISSFFFSECGLM